MHLTQRLHPSQDLALQLRQFGSCPPTQITPDFRLHKPIGKEKALFCIQLGIRLLKFTGCVAGNPLPEDQVLGPRR